MLTIFAGIYYWFPKMTGRMYNEKLGQLHFWLTFIGFNVTFFPMHYIGLQGMPRRVADYADRFGDFNLFISIASFGLGASTLIFLYNMIWSWKYGPPAGPNPWHALTLEWQVDSPPPIFNFAPPPPPPAPPPPPPSSIPWHLLYGSEIMLFGSFFTVYFFDRVVNPPHDRGRRTRPSARSRRRRQHADPGHVELHDALGDAVDQARQPAGLQAGLVLTFLLGLTFLLTQVIEYHRIGFNTSDGASRHLLRAHRSARLPRGVGLMILLAIPSVPSGGISVPSITTGSRSVGIYWHFVDVMWIIVLRHRLRAVRGLTPDCVRNANPFQERRMRSGSSADVIDLALIVIGSVDQRLARPRVFIVETACSWWSSSRPRGRRRAAGAAGIRPASRILVVANETVGGRTLLRDAQARGRPAPRGVRRLSGSEHRGQALDNDETGPSGRQERLDKSLTAIRGAGLDATGEIGDDDPLQAIEDALRTFAPDEIIISTHPEGRSNWLERGIVENARERFRSR